MTDITKIDSEPKGFTNRQSNFVEVRPKYASQYFVTEYTHGDNAAGVRKRSKLSYKQTVSMESLLVFNPFKEGPILKAAHAIDRRAATIATFLEKDFDCEITYHKPAQLHVPITLDIMDLLISTAGRMGLNIIQIPLEANSVTDEDLKTRVI